MPFLTDFPDDLRFVLGLHEGSVVGLATGWAIGREIRPSPSSTRPRAWAMRWARSAARASTGRRSSSSSASRIAATWRSSRSSPASSAGSAASIVWVEEPVRAQDVPGAIGRASSRPRDAARPGSRDRADGRLERTRRRGSGGRGAGARRSRGRGRSRRGGGLARFLEGAQAPALVVGAGADDAETWKALVGLAERLVAPVFQESFGARAGFPPGPPALRGRASGGPSAAARATRALRRDPRVVGAPAFRQSPYAPWPLHGAGTRIAIVGDNADEVSAAQPSSPCSRATGLRVPGPRRTSPAAGRDTAGAVPSSRSPGSSAAGEPLLAGHVLAALAERLPDEAVVVEEAPVDRPELHDRLLARRPLGFLSAAMGGLGFALAGATGVRMALPERPVVAVVGDGSALYGIQALWSARTTASGRCS